MTFFVRRPAAALAAGVMLFGLAAAAQAADPPAAAQQPAAADAHSGAPAASPPAKPDPQERVICREEEVTGTLLGGKRVCHTKRQWDQIERDADGMLDSHTFGNQKH